MSTMRWLPGPTGASGRRGLFTTERSLFASLVVGMALLAGGVASAAIGAQAAAAAPGDRGFELVSPAAKGGAELPRVGPIQVSGDGSRAYFLVRGVLPGAGSNGGITSYIAERGPFGWSTHSIDPPLAASPEFVGADFLAFSSDLGAGIVSSFDPPVPMPGETAGKIDLYGYDDATASYSLLTTVPRVEGPPTDDGARPNFAWASSDLQRVLVSAAQLVYFLGMPRNAVYYAADGEMTLESFVPDESTPDPDDEVVAASAAAGAGISVGGEQRALSSDGTRLFFAAVDSDVGFGLNTAAPGSGAQLYVRENPRTPDARTIWLSAPEAGVVDPTGTWAAWLRAASSDGSRAFFTSCQKLTADSSADSTSGGSGTCNPASDDTKSDLYLYDLEANFGDGDLIDLTTADAVNGADVQGVVGASEDGRRIYFVATGLLDPDEVGGEQGAVAGEPSLYLWEDGEGIEHVARLEFGDSDVWADPRLLEKESKLTVDGSRMTFSSQRQLDPAFDNAGHRMVYLYDAATDELTCLSCAGAGPALADATIGTQAVGGETLPSGWLEKQNLVAEGNAVFFETAESFAPIDSNGEVDVYEYSSQTDELSPISTGKSSSGSFFAGATPDGSSAFFTTREQIVGWDTDSALDLYAARVGGGFPEPAPPGDCGLDCQGAPPSAPALISPVTGVFQGMGNVDDARQLVRVRGLGARQKRRFARTGRLVLRLRIPAAGVVAVRWNRGSDVAAQAVRASTKRVTLRLGRRARAVLRRRGRLGVRIVVAFGSDRQTMGFVLRSRR